MKWILFLNQGMEVAQRAETYVTGKFDDFFRNYPEQKKKYVHETMVNWDTGSKKFILLKEKKSQ